MKKTTVLPAIALLLGGASLFLAGPAFAEDGSGDTTAVSANEQVCTELDSGKIDVKGEVYEVELVAPEGNLITGYCVKAGSINNENGPVYVELDEPVASLTIMYKDGAKAISHYSYSYAPIVKPTPTPTPEPTPEPTPTPTTPATTPATTPPAGGGDGGATLAETGFDAGWLPFAGIGVLALGAALVTPRLVAKRR